MSWTLPDVRTAGAYLKAMIGSLAAGLSVALVACAEDPAPSGTDADLQLDAGVCEPCPECVESVPIMGSNHVQGMVKYPDPPPASGDHNPCWAAWGVHEKVVPAERWVHNLEHGGVVFLYACSPDCPEEREVLEVLVRSNPRSLLTAYPQLRTRFAVVAWGQRLQTDCLDAHAFLEFYSAHHDHGPESLDSPPPAGCE